MKRKHAKRPPQERKPAPPPAAPRQVIADIPRLLNQSREIFDGWLVPPSDRREAVKLAPSADAVPPADAAPHVAPVKPAKHRGGRPPCHWDEIDPAIDQWLAAGKTIPQPAFIIDIIAGYELRHGKRSAPRDKTVQNRIQMLAKRRR